MSTIALMTLSFRGDFDPCVTLCNSIERFVPASVQHILAVPRSDMELFSQLRNSRRIIVCQEDLLPKWLWKVPLPSPAWRKRLFLPRRNIYIAKGVFLVRGWIAQQLMKISLASRISTEIVLIIDSDAVFIRPLNESAIVHAGKARLQRFTITDESATQKKWDDASAKLLGLPQQGHYGLSFMDHLICWRPATVKKMLEKIEATGGKDWASILASMSHFSEYNLYGIYCENVLGLEVSGHFGSNKELCLSIWRGNHICAAPSREYISNMIDSHLEEHHYAFAIQSTVPVSAETRQQLVAAATRRAEEADKVQCSGLFS